MLGIKPRSDTYKMNYLYTSSPEFLHLFLSISNISFQQALCRNLEDEKPQSPAEEKGPLSLSPQGGSRAGSGAGEPLALSSSSSCSFLLSASWGLVKPKKVAGQE